MNRKLGVAFILTVLVGCSYQGKSLESYLEDPSSIVKDPHYESYQQKSEELESAYLNKEITYAEYVEKKKELEDKYTKEVKAREDVVIPSQ